MTTAVLTEREAALRAILADPENDLHRLEFADWLLEHGRREVVCPKCKGDGRERGYPAKTESHHCPTCHGSGTVTDDTDERWGELIKVQWELSRFGPNDSNVARHMTLKKQERELLTTLEPIIRRGQRCRGRCNEDGWLEGFRAGNGYYTQPRCPDCRGTGWLGSLAERGMIFRNDWGPGMHAMTPTGTDWLVPITRWRCGFPDEVSLTLEQFTRIAGRQVCNLCRGTRVERYADIPPLDYKLLLDPPKPSDRTFEIKERRCSRCEGRGYQEVPFAALLFKEHPLTGVVLTEIVDGLPEYLLDRIEQLAPKWPVFGQQEVSLACCEWGRSEAEKLKGVS